MFAIWRTGGGVTANALWYLEVIVTVPQAIIAFLAAVKGEEHFVHAGEVLPPNHPVVKARPELFEAEPKAKASRPRGRRVASKT